MDSLIIKVHPYISIIVGNMEKIVMSVPVYIGNKSFVSDCRSNVETTPDKVWVVYRERWKGKDAILLSEEFPSKPELPSDFEANLNMCISSSMDNYEDIRSDTRQYALRILRIIHCDRDHQLKGIKQCGISQLLALASFEIDQLKLSSSVMFYILLYLMYKKKLKYLYMMFRFVKRSIMQVF